MEKLLKMSFFNGTLDIQKAKEVVNNTNKKLSYRYGLSYRGAEAYPISKDKALEILDNNNGLLDVNEYEDEIILNEYSCNDML